MKSINRNSFAKIYGGNIYPDIRGLMTFQNVAGGTMVCVEVNGLPEYKPGNGHEPIGPLGMHIHEYGICEICDPENPFESAGSHWNPYDQPHGNHAGDFPVLFSNKGFAKMCFFTDKFKPEDVVNKSIIIHQNPDDYRTQPAGDSGKRIACGIIVRQY